MPLIQVTSVTLKDERTGIVVTRPEKTDWYESLYWWTEGNMGCDCNRGRVYFDVATGCNRGANRFTLMRLELSDGTVFDDFTELNPSQHLGWCGNCDN